MLGRSESGVRKIGLIGVGNLLMGDDGLGPHVIERLAGRLRPTQGEAHDDSTGKAGAPRSELLIADLGTPSTSEIAGALAGLSHVVIVDAIRSRGNAGELVELRKPQILDHATPVRLSPHEPGLQEALLLLELAGQCPDDVRIIGARIEHAELRVGLSPPLLSILDELEARVLSTLIEWQAFHQGPKLTLSA